MPFCSLDQALAVQKKGLFSFYYGVSPWEPFGYVNPSQYCLGLISVWHQLTQNLGSIPFQQGSLGGQTVPFKRRKRQNFKYFLDPLAACRTWVLQHLSMFG